MPTDAERFAFLESEEASLLPHREWAHGKSVWHVWWAVVKRRRSISGHPLGSPREAIDAAIARKETNKGKI